MFALLAASYPSYAQPASPSSNACTAHVTEAASRSGLSAEIVLRVMMAESGGDARIVSPKGAMGCMQIMPATWAYLSARYNLGADPFDVRRNMIGGAMYLAELAGRYGIPGALAAYNAGPGRYERYAAGRATLPAETIAYSARIGSDTAAVMPVQRPRWQEAALFPTHDGQLKGGETALQTSASRPASAQLFPLAASTTASGGDPNRHEP